jgi:SAM-dependent methyltransferase
MSVTPITPDVDRERHERAYLEYRRACYGVMERHAHDRGVLAALAEPKTAEQLGAELGVVPARAGTLELFLAALVRHGTIVRDGDRYVVARGVDPNPTYDEDLIAAAIGYDKVEALIHANSYQGLVDALTSQENPVATPFTKAHLDLWDEFVQAPFYGRFRREAARVSIPGGTSLDLACGLGYGLHEHLEVVGPEGRIVGVERSRDFLHQILDRTASEPQITVCQGDLEEGVWFLSDAAFDTVTLTGAYQFIANRELLLSEVRRVLRPGGRFCNAYVYESRGSYDQELMDLRFSMREPKATPTSEAGLHALAERSGFRVESSWHVGCFGFHVFVAV